MQQTQIFESIYLCNLAGKTFDISNLNNSIYPFSESKLSTEPGELGSMHSRTLYRIHVRAYSSVYPTKAWGLALHRQLSDFYFFIMTTRGLRRTPVSFLILQYEYTSSESSASLRISEDALYSPACSQTEPLETQSS